MSIVDPKKIILFEEDWDYFPQAVPHWETTNTSWRDLAILYRREFGVRNSAFFMALLNPRLIGVDPHAPNLTSEQIQMISAECYLNPWYFFREVMRVPAKAGDNKISFRANRGNIPMLWGIFTRTNWYQIQIRQTGKSMTMLGLFCYLTYVRSRNTEVIQLTKDGDARTKTVEDVRSIRDLLPAYLWTLDSRDSSNKENVTYTRFKNKLSVKIPRSDKKQATNIGRGLTTPIFHSDETAFTKYIEIIVPAGIGAMGAARDEALSNGDLTSIIYTTTAGELDKREGKWAYEVFMRSAPFSESFFDCRNEKHLHQTVLNNVPCELSKATVRIGAQWNHAQLGFSDEWLAKTMNETEGDKLQKDRDYMNIWTNGSAESPLTAEMVEMIMAGQREIDHIEISPEGYCINWYIPRGQIETYMQNNKVVAGLDTSDAIGRDAIGLVMVDVETAEVVATGRFNKLSLLSFARWMANLMMRYKNVTLIPERKSSAIMLLDAIEEFLRQAGIDVFKRVYNTIVDRHADNPAMFEDLKLPLSMRDESWYAQRKRHLGFTTDARKRMELYSDILMEGIVETRGQLRDKMLCSEILGLVIKDGRVDHQDGMHDDMTFAWMLAMWFIKRAKKQIHYGIDPLKVMSRLPASVTGEIDPYEAYLNQQQAKLRQRVAEIYELLKTETNGLILDRLEAELLTYKGKIRGEDSASVSIDAMITKAREERANTYRQISRSSNERNISRNAWMTMGQYRPGGFF